MTPNLRCSERAGWLEILRDAGDTGASVECPVRGRCTLSTCLDCTDLDAIGFDPKTGGSFLACRQSRVDAPRAERLMGLHAPDGGRSHFRASAHAQPEPGGTWQGWVEFADPSGSTPRVVFDTTDRRRSAMDEWASGLSRYDGRGLLIAREVAEHAEREREQRDARTDFASGAESAPASAVEGRVVDDDTVALLGEQVVAYRGLAELFGGPVTDAVLGEARALLESLDTSLLDPSGSFPPLVQALRSTSAAALSAALCATFRARAEACVEPSCDIRQWACVAAELAPDASCATDLAVLASLAERVVWAYRFSGNRPLAIAMARTRQQFFDEHAVSCAGSRSRVLMFAETPLLRQAGAALTALLDSETREVPRSAGPAHSDVFAIGSRGIGTEEIADDDLADLLRWAK